MASSFVKKLYEMVEHENNDIICWVAQGVAFEVLDPKRLEAEILPKFFRHSRFQSLVRQLNFYAFKKVSKERSSWVYSHECFVAGQPERLDLLKRKTNGSAMELNGGSLDLLQRQELVSGDYPDEYTAMEDVAGAAGAAGAVSVGHSPTGSATSSRKRSFSTSSSDFQFCPSDEDEQQDWSELDATTATEGAAEQKCELSHAAPSSTPRSTAFNPLIRKSGSFHSFTSAPNLPGLHSPGRGAVFSLRKKLRRCYSLGEVDNTSYDTDINFEKILSNWNNVHHFFTNKCDSPSEAEEEEEVGDVSNPPFSPDLSSPGGSSEDQEDQKLSIEVNDSAESSSISSTSNHSDTSVSLLLQFCLEKDPWQRASQLCGDIQRLLAADPPLMSEMTAYSEALSPSSQQGDQEREQEREMLQQREESNTDVDSDSDGEHPTSSSCWTPHTPRLRLLVQRKSPHLLSPHCRLTHAHRKVSLCPSPRNKISTPSCEITTVRTFLAFSLACLHSAATREEGDPERQASLLACAGRWGEYAQCCL